MLRDRAASKCNEVVGLVIKGDSDDVLPLWLPFSSDVMHGDVYEVCTASDISGVYTLRVLPSPVLEGNFAAVSLVLAIPTLHGVHTKALTFVYIVSCQAFTCLFMRYSMGVNT